jgi:hypothetical protein
VPVELLQPFFGIMLCYVMVPLLPPVNCVEDSWGWWLHATSAQLAARLTSEYSMRCSPSRFFNPRFYRRWVHCFRHYNAYYYAYCEVTLLGRAEVILVVLLLLLLLLLLFIFILIILIIIIISHNTYYNAYY